MLTDLSLHLLRGHIIAEVLVIHVGKQLLQRVATGFGLGPRVLEANLSLASEQVTVLTTGDPYLLLQNLREVVVLLLEITEDLP